MSERAVNDNGISDAGVSSNSVAITTDDVLRGKVYEVRGQKAMLDFELAEIYGYTTKAFNQQVRRNIEKFDGDDFMFRITRGELEDMVRCKKMHLTRNQLVFRSRRRHTLPPLRLCRTIRLHVIENHGLIGQREFFALPMGRVQRISFRIIIK